MAKRLHEGFETDTHFEFCITADHPALDGHFPDDPMVPGALLLAELIARLGAVMIFISGIRQVRFMRPVRPMDQISVHGRTDAGGQFRFECQVADVVVMRGSLLVAGGASDD